MSRIVKEVYHPKKRWGMYAYQYTQKVSDWDIEHGIYKKGDDVRVYLTDENNEVMYFDSKEEALKIGSGEKDGRAMFVKNNLSR